ncbi:acyltransferase family protein [Cytophaga aurantiaca]|uniref:acyltransferase family protein n=1 Tax=Cytophaga aurantiaca TaxID=29530 RepID=UPI00146137A8|nr:acyltransferase [Cytophaga aurantiaca]
MRIIAAAMVIVTHSLVLVGVGVEQDILYKMSGGEIMISTLGLRTFFVISGLLIMQSMDRSTSRGAFVWKRILRIFPGLIICVLITVCIIGPVFTSKTITEYFQLRSTWSYLINLTLFKTQETLPSVFESNIVPVVNGSIWTLAYEFSYYMMVLGLSFIGIFKRKWIIFIVFFIFFVVQLINIYCTVPPKYFYFLMYTDLRLNHFSDFGLYFTSGVIAYLYRERISYTNKFAALALAGYVICIFFNIPWLLKYVALPYLILYVGYLSINPRISMWGKNGDYSYGIYIYGMIVQQSILALLGVEIDPYLLSLIALITVFPFAWLSWHLVEKNALKLKSI